jgi:SAM-dependent methyltransferase
MRSICHRAVFLFARLARAGTFRRPMQTTSRARSWAWRCPRHGRPLSADGTALVCDAGHRFEALDTAGGTFHDFVGDDQGLSPLELEQRRTYDATDSRYAVEASGAERDFMQRFTATFGSGRLKGRDELMRALVDHCHLAPGQRVLELGCNDGRYLGSLARRYGVEGVGIDLSVAAIRRALSLRVQPSVEFHAALADALPFEAGSFDAVISFDVFEHLGHAALGRALAETARVLKPGGALLCYVISQRDQYTFHETLRRLTAGRRGVDDGEGHAWENFVSPDQLRALCQGAGLRLEQVRAYHGFWTLFADEHLQGAPPRAVYKVLEWLDAPLTRLEYGNGFFGLARAA